MTTQTSDNLINMGAGPKTQKKNVNAPQQEQQIQRNMECGTFHGSISPNDCCHSIENDGRVVFSHDQIHRCHVMCR
jgi:hypothetical protein